MDSKYHNQKAFYVTLLCLIFLVVFLLFNDTDFRDFTLGNLIPELIGMCVELLIVIKFFESWQTQKEHEKSIIHEKRLREYFIFFLKHGLKDISKDLEIGNFYGENHEKNTQEIKKIVKYISETTLSTEQLHSIKEHLLIDKSAFENLLEVASRLSDAHFKSWIRITYFINSLSRIDDDENTKKAIIDILQNINKFDEASFKSKIYVGAKY